MNNTPPNINIETLIQIAIDAGDIIMQYFQHNLEINFKNDRSPVTKADIAANQFIVESLKKMTPNIPVVAEENLQSNNILQNNKSIFWLVDPIDNTKGFIRGDTDFTVNIGLIYEQKPIIGVIYAPAENKLYYTEGKGESYKIQNNQPKQVIHCKKIIDNKLDILISKSSDINFIKMLHEKNYYINSINRVGSSLKLCYIAEGKADAYPRIGLTMEWDTAAGHAILNEAGGDIVSLDSNKSLTYCKNQFKNPSFIAFGSQCNNL